MLRFVACVLSLLPLLPTVAGTQETSANAHSSNTDKVEVSTQPSICLLIESAALSNELPIEFFVRLIWQESRFEADAIGPSTRSGKHALGIAQFMPGTRLTAFF